MNVSPTSMALLGWLLLCLVLFSAGILWRGTRKIAGAGLVLMLALFGAWVAWAYGFNQGTGREGRTSITAQLEPSKDADGNMEPVTHEAVEKAAHALDHRLDPARKLTVTAIAEGSDRIVLELPAVAPGAMDQVLAEIQKQAHLEFRLVHPNSEGELAKMKAQGSIPVGWVEMPNVEQDRRANRPATLLVKPRADLDGSYVKNATALRDRSKGWEIALEFNDEGKKLFATLTTNNVNRQLAIIVNGEIIMAPFLRDPILMGKVDINGRFTEAEAVALADALANPVKNPVKILQTTSVTAVNRHSLLQTASFGAVGTMLVTAFFFHCSRTATAV